jgi:hypothetical protein
MPGVADPEAGSLKKSTLLSAALLAAHAGVVGWAVLHEARAWPHVGSYVQFVFFLATPGILFHAVKLAFLWRVKRPPARRWLVRLFTIPAGLFLAGALVSAADGRARASFERAYAPFLAQVEAHLADACGRTAELYALPSVVAFNRGAGLERPGAKLSYDRQRFVLAFGGGSIDIDGSTIYFDSKTGSWSQFHNDDKEATAAYEKLTAGLSECILRVAEP